jgi:hypothetical protein
MASIIFCCFGEPYKGSHLEWERRKELLVIELIVIWEIPVALISLVNIDLLLRLSVETPNLGVCTLMISLRLSQEMASFGLKLSLSIFQF